MDEIDLLIEKQDYIDKEMIDVSIEYWFRDHDNIRSPFPDYIKSDLKGNAVKKFLTWAGKLTPEGKKEINDEILLERFEELLFEEAIKMVMTEDEKITIKYPFMLRMGDKVKEGEKPESIVVGREITSENDTSYLKITFEETANGKKWDSSFEIPG